MASSGEFPIGSKVKVTFHGQQTVGEVSSYNGSPGKDHWMILRSPCSEKPNSPLVITYNLSKVDSVELLERSTRPSVAVSSLPRVNIGKLNSRAHQAVQQKLAASRRESGGQVRLGQLVCDRLNESGFNCTWQRNDIVVLDALRIKPPYKPESIVSEPNARRGEDFAQRIRKIVSEVVSSAD